MSENSEETAPEATANESESPAQETIDWKAEARKWEARSKENKTELDDAQARLQADADAKLSDIDKANKAAADAAAETATLKSENARLLALATHPVPEDYRDLVTGTDADSYLASAKKISELYARAEGKPAKPGVVHGSGDRSGDNNPTGGSLAAGRELYAAKNPQK